MTRFSGAVGYGVSVEKVPGVATDTIVEYKYKGDVVRSTRAQREATDKLNFDLSVSVSISIVADPFARQNFFAIRYVMWAGKAWTVTNVDNSTPPRLILSLGEVYNGPKA